MSEPKPRRDGNATPRPIRGRGKPEAGPHEDILNEPESLQAAVAERSAELFQPVADRA